MRQFPETETLQYPRSRPLRGWSPKPGTARCRGTVAWSRSVRTPRIRGIQSGSSWLASPLSWKRRSPRCVIFTRDTVSCSDTGYQAGGQCLGTIFCRGRGSGVTGSGQVCAAAGPPCACLDGSMGCARTGEVPVDEWMSGTWSDPLVRPYQMPDTRGIRCRGRCHPPAFLLGQSALLHVSDSRSSGPTSRPRPEATAST